MDDRLANHLIGLYEKGLKEYGIEIVDVKYGGRSVTLWVKSYGETKEYSDSFKGGTVLDSHVAVLRKAYWEERDKKEKPMKGTLTYKDIYKQ
jgi:hypothetical protein